MYKPVITSSGQVQDSESLESKYTVAEILSSMTVTSRDQVPITPVSFSSGVAPSYPVNSGVGLLTPTTFANLERSFELASQSSDQVPTSSAAESGFVPPVVNPIVIDPLNSGANNMPVKREYDPSWDEDLSSCSSTDPEWNPLTKKRRTDNTPVANIDPNTFLMTNSRRPTGPRKERNNEMLPPDEVEKRSVRRERNKQAAAKCRQRRVEQTNVLINETENLEEEKAELETEIQNLQQQKEQLQFLLEAHKPACKHNPHMSNSVAPVKSEHDLMSNIAVSFGGHVHTATTTAHQPIQSRPSTLPLRMTQLPTTSAPGIPITTPSGGVFSHLGLDTLLDGHTGLTPLTTGPSCGSQVQQQHRNSSDSSPTEMGSPNSNLISL